MPGPAAGRSPPPVSYHGFTVLDGETPSRLIVPKKAGRVTVPFVHAVIAVEVEHHRCVLEVHAGSAGAPGWAGAWVSYLNLEPALTTDGVGHQAGLVRSPVRGSGRAAAEVVPGAGGPVRAPAAAAGVEREDRIPSNREIAQRLNVSLGVVENHHLDRLRRELGLPRFSEQMRLAAVLLAISQGIVTSADLPLLDLDGGEGPGDGAPPIAELDGPGLEAAP